MTGHRDHRAEGSVAEYDRQCREAIIEHWADKILARPTREEQQAQVEATPAKIKQAARLRALDKLQEQQQG